jgi:hypothetical protein
MATFRVGQRVKLVKPFDPKNYGVTGTVSGYMYLTAGTVCDDGLPTPTDTDLLVVWDVESSTHVQASWQLEPIQDRPELSSWEALQALGLDVESVKGEEAKGRALKDLGLDVDRVREIAEVA